MNQATFAERDNASKAELPLIAGLERMESDIIAALVRVTSEEIRPLPGDEGRRRSETNNQKRVELKRELEQLRARRMELRKSYRMQAANQPVEPQRGVFGVARVNIDATVNLQEEAILNEEPEHTIDLLSNSLMHSAVVSIEPAGSSPIEKHERSFEIITVVCGHGKLLIYESNTEVMLEPGVTTLVPRNVSHAIRNSSTRHALKLIEIHVPPK